MAIVLFRRLGWLGAGSRDAAVAIFAVAIAMSGMGAQTNTASAQTLDEGLRLYNLGNFDGAMKEWQPLANQGDPDALFNLGQIHRLGRGVPINLPVAESYYTKAAAAGHVTAQANLATILFFNKGNASRQTEAVRLWGQAAAAGDSSSQYMLSILHYNGEVVELDPVRAYAWARLAVDGGHEAAVQAKAIIGAALNEEERTEAQRLSFTLVRPAVAGMPPVAGASPQLELVETGPVATPEAIPAATQAGKGAAPITETSVVSTTPPKQPAPKTPVAASGNSKSDYRSLDGRWRVQLGSFREAENADVLRAEIKEKMAGRLAGLWWDLARLDLGADKGIYYRLLIGPLRDRAGSDIICDELKAKGFDCFVVAAGFDF